MATLSRFSFRYLTAVLSVIVGMIGLLTTRHCAWAQTTGDTTETTDSQTKDQTGTDKNGTDKTNTDKSALVRKPRPRPAAPPPGNPLVKINPEDGSGNDTKDYNPDGTRKVPRKLSSKDYGDYRPNADDPRVTRQPKSLPIFGYDFFAPSRQLLDARRAALYRQYPDLRPKTNSSQRRSTTRNGPNSRRQSDQNDNQTDSNPSGDATTSRTGRRPNSKDRDSTDDTQTNPDRSTRATDSNDGTNDDNSSNTNGPTGTTHRQRGMNTDDQTDNSDDTDNQDRSQRDTAGSRNIDQNSDDTDDTSVDDQQQQLAMQNRRRELLGLPPLTDDATDTTGTRRTNTRRDDGMDNYLTGSAMGTSRSRTSSRYNNNSDYPYGRNGSYQDDQSFRDDNRGPIDAFNSLADPLTLLTHNLTATAPANYQLSGGDRVLVRYSNPAMSPREITSTVDPQGVLTLDEVGHVNVAGMTLGQASEEVKRRLSRLYKKVDVMVSLRELRTISVTVSGKAYLPGEYHVPAVMTASQVLYACGGPTKDGSLRSIEIRRQNKIIPFDFYKMMTLAAPGAVGKSGSMKYQSDIPLQSGDVIYIPSYHERVALAGEVREQAQYELKEGETLDDVLNFAGGIKASGIGKHVQVSTIDPGNARIIKDVDLKNTAQVSTLALYDGDVVNVLALRPVVQNKVTIDGAVAQPSDYALTPNMHVADLVRAAGNPISEAWLGHAALYRWNSNGTTSLISIDLAKALDGDPESNQPLMKWDRLEIYSRGEAFFAGNRKVTVRGAVQRPSVYAYADNMHVRDLLFKVGGPLPDAEMVVVEHNHGDGTKKYEFVSVADVVHNNTAKDIALEDNDIVAVYRNGETDFIPEHKVMILGAVQTPGMYDRGEGMKLSELIKLAGDFKPEAGEKVVVAHARRPADGPDSGLRTVAVLFDSQHRCDPKDDVRLEDGDEVLLESKGGFEDKPAVAHIDGLVNHPGYYPITSKKMRLSELITMAGGLLKEAFPEGAEFYRDPKKLGTQQQREIARIVSDLSDLNNASAFKRELAKSDLERMRASGSASQSGSPLNPTAAAVPNPASAALAIEIAKHDLVSKGRVLSNDDLEPTGNIAVNLPAAMRRPGGADDILLVDGDKITIPETPTTVMVEGAVVNPRGVLYKEGAPLSYYVAQAGGYAPDAAKDRIVVIHAGGGLAPGNEVRTLRTGDAIIVPTRVMAEKLPNGNSGVGNFFNSLISGALIFRLFGL
jgi:protein involved in polysaccharide export with SLBB domain